MQMKAKKFYPEILCITLSTIHLVSSAYHGIITLDPENIRVYYGRRGNRKIATIKGVVTDPDNKNTSEKFIKQFHLKNSLGSDDFRISNIGTPSLRTSRTIFKLPGYVYNLEIVGQTIIKNITYTFSKQFNITITKYNRHSPSFTLRSYRFAYSANAPNDSFLGSVIANDRDTPIEDLTYNVVDTRFIYIKSRDGVHGVDVYLNNAALAKLYSYVQTSIRVFDNGTPARFGYSSMILYKTTLPMIQKFCASVRTEAINVCWKVPGDYNSEIVSFRLNMTHGKNRKTLSYNISSTSYFEDEVCAPINISTSNINTSITTYMWSIGKYGKSQRSSIFTVQIPGSELQGLKNDCLSFNACNLLKPCQNAGICQQMDLLQFKCKCSEKWVGKKCDKPNLCINNPCKNEGNCSMTDENTFKCLCPRKYLGRFCQYTDECYDHPCSNNGQCITGPAGKATCVCRRMYRGKKCETYDACQSSPCENKAVCSISGTDDYKCACRPGFYGKVCNKLDICDIIPDYCLQRGKCEIINDSAVCHCYAGWQGNRCQNTDLCNTNPCLNSGGCKYLDHLRYKCTCGGGFYGKSCQLRDRCFDKPCLNNGNCKNYSDSFNCICRPGFSGKLCEIYDKCVEEPCQHNGLCNFIAHNEYTCTCTTEGIYGKQCEHLNICESDRNPCLNNATCTNTSTDGEFTCKCGEFYSGKTCHKREYCEASITNDSSGNYTWPVTLAGKVARVVCMMGPADKYVQRLCIPGDNVTWGDPVPKGCMSGGEQAALEALNGLKDLTSDPSGLTSDQIGKAADTLGGVVEYTYQKVEIAKVMTDVVSNVMGAAPEVLREGQITSGNNDKLLAVLNKYTSDVVISQGNNVSLVSGDLNVMTIDVQLNESATDSFTVNSHFGSSQNVKGPSVVLSEDVLNSLNSTDTARIQMVSMGNSKFYVDPTSDLTPDTNVPVVSFSLKGVSVNMNNSSAVTINMPSPHVSNRGNRNFTCIFWDDVNNQWSTKGVVTVYGSGNITICQSSHLTSFSILLDPEPSVHIPKIHEIIQTYITYIGCGISIIALILTLLTYAMFRCLHGDRSGKICINMCLALLLLNSAFLIGSLAVVQRYLVSCMIIALLLHYLIISLFLWMLIEGVMMYIALIVVFSDRIRYFILKALVIGWGAPAIVVGITVGVSRDFYRLQDKFCFISQANVVAFYVAVLTPVCLTLLVNIIVFIRVTMVVIGRRQISGMDSKSNKQPSITAAQVRGCIAVMVLLGLTWVLGPLAIGEAKLVFSYLFTILNSIQGLLVFIFRVVLNKEARLAWHQLVTTGTLKKKRGVTSVVTLTASESGPAKTSPNGR